MRSALALLNVFASVADAGDRVWLGGESLDPLVSAGVYCLDTATGMLDVFGPDDGLGCKYCWDIERVDGVLWIATYGGLVRVVPKAPGPQERSQRDGNGAK